MNQFVKILCAFPLFFISSFSQANNSATIGLGTEINFQSETGGIAFLPCSDEPKDSCSDFVKKEDQMSSKKCTFRVKNANILKMEAPKGGRTLTVSKITQRDSEYKATSVLLTGAKAPVELTCSSEIKYPTGTQTIPNFPLTDKLLKNFKDFSLGKTVLERSQPAVPKLEAPVAPKSSGSVI